MKEKFSEKIKIYMSAICRRKSCEVMLCSFWDRALTAAIRCEETQNKTKKNRKTNVHTDRNRKEHPAEKQMTGTAYLYGMATLLCWLNHFISDLRYMIDMSEETLKTTSLILQQDWCRSEDSNIIT